MSSSPDMVRRYTSIINPQSNPEIDFSRFRVSDLTVHVIVGPDGSPGLNFNIGGINCDLAPNQIRELIRTCFKRLANEKGFRPNDIDYKVVHGVESMSRKSRKMEKEAVRNLK